MSSNPTKTDEQQQNISPDKPNSISAFNANQEIMNTSKITRTVKRNIGNNSMTLEEDVQHNPLAANDESLNMEPTVVIRKTQVKTQAINNENRFGNTNSINRKSAKVSTVRNLRYKEYEHSIDSKFSKSKLSKISKISKNKKVSQASKSKSATINSIQEEEEVLKEEKISSFTNFSFEEEVDYFQDLFQIERENILELRIEEMEAQQTEIKWTMRSILLDWMSEVAYDFELGRETFYYAAKYLDMCLARKPGIEKSKFQILGLTCLFIACKMEEILPPSIDHMVELCGSDVLTKEEMYKEEVAIMKVNLVLEY